MWEKHDLTFKNTVLWIQHFCPLGGCLFFFYSQRKDLKYAEMIIHQQSSKHTKIWFLTKLFQQGNQAKQEKKVTSVNFCFGNGFLSLHLHYTTLLTLPLHWTWQSETLLGKISVCRFPQESAVEPGLPQGLFHTASTESWVTCIWLFTFKLTIVDLKAMCKDSGCRALHQGSRSFLA